MRARWSGAWIVGLGLLLSSSAWAKGPASATHARGSSGLFWFMHISDLHTSCDWNPTDEHKNMQLAFGPANQIIQPWFIVATGDLVDGSPFGVPTTGQSQAEWDEYKGLYKAAGLTTSTYFDIPGNHDGYGDIGFNHYLANSLQGSANNSTYMTWVVDTPLGSYRFFGLDSAGKGSGPFTEQPEFLQAQIDTMKSDLASDPDPELVFVLAHHPITTPKNSSQVVDFMKAQGGGFYLHGHVHEYDEYTSGDPTIVSNEINTLGQSGDSNIGVGAVDHNAFVYRATNSKAPWPMVMITAPVSTTLRNGKENPFAYAVCKDRVDNPVRALVFGEGTPSQVTVELGTLAPVAMTAATQPTGVWEADLDTTTLPAGVTDVRVTAAFGAKTASHTVSAELVDGPCDPLPEDPAADGGVDADAGAEAGGAAGEAGASAGGSGGGATGGAAGTASSTGGAAGSSTGSSEDGGEEDGGCACRATPLPSGAGAHPLLLLAALALVRRRTPGPRRRR